MATDELLLGFKPSANKAGQQLLLAALLQQDSSINWQDQMQHIEWVTGCNVDDTDPSKGSSAWMIKVFGVDTSFNLKYVTHIKEQLLVMKSDTGSLSQPTAAQHRVMPLEAPALQHALSAAVHAGPVLGLVDMETSVLPGCGATQQAQERLNTLLGPAINSHNSAHRTKVNTKHVAAVPTAGQTATATSRRMPCAAGNMVVGDHPPCSPKLSIMNMIMNMMLATKQHGSGLSLSLWDCCGTLCPEHQLCLFQSCPDVM